MSHIRAPSTVDCHSLLALHRLRRQRRRRRRVELLVERPQHQEREEAEHDRDQQRLLALGGGVATGAPLGLDSAVEPRRPGSSASLRASSRSCWLFSRSPGPRGRHGRRRARPAGRARRRRRAWSASQLDGRGHPRSVREAVARLQGVVHTTPLFHSRLLDEVAGGTILLKAENLQRSGAFKFRGAYNAIAKNLADCRKAGVTTGSSGNHGGAVALAASLLGVRAVIVMPVDAAGVKVAAVRDCGAEVVKFGRTNEERLAHAWETGLARRPRADPPLRPSRRDRGAGDVRRGDLRRAVARRRPRSDGRRRAVFGRRAVRLRRALRRPRCGASRPRPRATPGSRSTRAARPHRSARHDRGRHADAVAGRAHVPDHAAHARGVVLVSERDVREAMVFLMTRMKLVVEPTGAVGVAAVLKRRIDLNGRTAVVVL